MTIYPGGKHCMREWPDLTGQRFGKLVVTGQAESSARGQRRWKCKCDCGNITYKATDTLTNSDVSMCKECAEKYCASKAREKAGFTEGTQVSKIKYVAGSSHNLSGVRGVYLDRKTGRYRARIKFKGKLYNLGSYSTLDEAVKARKWGEEEYFGSFLAGYEERNKHIETGTST